MNQLCKSCKAFLLEYEIKFCEGSCSDCCEETYNVNDTKCNKKDCPNTVCNSRVDAPGEVCDEIF